MGLGVKKSDLQAECAHLLLKGYFCAGLCPPPSRACLHGGVVVPHDGAGVITALSWREMWSQAARLGASIPFPGLSPLLLTVSLEGGHLEAPSTGEKLGHTARR